MTFDEEAHNHTMKVLTDSINETWESIMRPKEIHAEISQLQIQLEKLDEEQQDLIRAIVSNGLKIDQIEVQIEELKAKLQ